MTTPAASARTRSTASSPAQGSCPSACSASHNRLCKSSWAMAHWLYFPMMTTRRSSLPSREVIHTLQPADAAMCFICVPLLPRMAPARRLGTTTCTCITSGSELAGQTSLSLSVAPKPATPAAAGPGAIPAPWPASASALGSASALASGSALASAVCSACSSSAAFAAGSTGGMGNGVGASAEPKRDSVFLADIVDMSGELTATDAGSSNAGTSCAAPRCRFGGLSWSSRSSSSCNHSWLRISSKDKRCEGSN
mmetsp:Transcript_116148/g.375292  ORF Transcript_116148/g.375292 Transcript_116148/m.375292 type:complete len:253 (+) Transcript_116148:847-1605(+)